MPTPEDPPSHTLTSPGRLIAPPVSIGESSHQLPTDLTERAAERLGVMAWIIAAIVAVEAVFSHGYSYLTDPKYPASFETWDALGAALVIAISLAAFAVLRSARRTARTRIQLGIGYLVLISYAVNCVDHLDHFWQHGHNLHGVPVVTILFLIFPVLVPMRPLRAMGVALAMAATGPLALCTLWLGLHYERPHLSALISASTFFWRPLWPECLPASCTPSELS